LSSVSLLFGYNGTPLRPQNSKTSELKIEAIIIITLMTDLG